MSNDLLRSMPSIEGLLARPIAKRLSLDLSRDRVRDLLRNITDDIRQELFKSRSVESELKAQLEEGESVIGGGSAPEVKLPTVVVALEGSELSAVSIKESLRHHSTSIITRTERDRVLIDLRTVAEQEEAIILDALVSMLDG